MTNPSKTKVQPGSSAMVSALSLPNRERSAMRGSPAYVASCRGSLNGHPLELMPFFRRFAPGLGRDVMFTLILNLAIGAAIILVAMALKGTPVSGRFLWQNLVISQCIGFSIHGFFAIGDRLLKPNWDSAPAALRAAYFIVIPVVGVFVGYGISFALLDLPQATQWLFSLDGARMVAIVSVIASLVFWLLVSVRIKQGLAEVRLAQEQQRSIDAERRALEAQLRLLQAQIEPHFLYNTLANVVSLVDTTPAKAKLLLERLIAYLRATLAVNRNATTDLGTEFAGIQTYLELMQIRMGQRLQFVLDLPPDLSTLSLPPMLLQPLVENAIQHGLELKIEGGTVRVSARRSERGLLLEVTDDGVGFGAAMAPAVGPVSGGGIGLSNLRQRLEAHYGSNASLELIENQGGGLCVRVALPVHLRTEDLHG